MNDTTKKKEPKKGRIKADGYSGVFYREAKRIGKSGIEKVYYVVFKKNGKLIEEKVGRQYADDMTAAKASLIRGRLIEGNDDTRREKKEKKAAEQRAEESRWTFDKLSAKYFESRPENKSRAIDQGRYDNYIKPAFGDRQPIELVPLDIDRIRLTLSKKKSPQTVKHVLNLLTWIVNYGKKNNLCSGLEFHVKKPEVHNTVTEDLTPEQLSKLIKVIDENQHLQAGIMMKLVLFTGMRRGELFKLKWKDINFDRGFIIIRQPKGGRDQQIPLNDSARALLESLPKSGDYVFSDRDGKQIKQNIREAREIKIAASLPEGFRPFHGLRHTYASMLASSGQVDMYTLQRLMTHKDPRMTQRYAHLRDESLKRASNIAGDIINKIEGTEPGGLTILSEAKTK
jgi:integrase